MSTIALAGVRIAGEETIAVPGAGVETTAAVSDILLYTAGLLAGVLALGLLVWYYRRRMHQTQEIAQPWTLHDLRQLHAAGQISDEEFDRLKAQMISGIRGDAAVASNSGEG
ncbi:MAG TPA: SHOCT domain-containing protein [Phycisphaerae bacterium]|nr:SHOCT domain-containing protein [Phycisphaerae bacterium]